MEFIKANPDPNSKNAALYTREGMPKIPLTRGKPAFQEFAAKLRETEPMGNVEFREDLKINISEDTSLWADKKYIGDVLQKFKDENKESKHYKNFNFQYDIGSPYAENSIIIQIVDDGPFKGTRSKNILNPSYAHVGITCQKVKNKHCGYFLFAS